MISIVIPVYNRSELLRRALVSVSAQSLPPDEIIVVDDCSTEDIAAVVSEFAALPVTLVRRDTRGGAAVARNSGITQAQRRFVAFLDSDDVWALDKLRHQIAYHEAHPGIRLSCTGYTLVRRNGAEELITHDNLDCGLKSLAFGCNLSPGSTLLAERSLFDDVGTFDEDLPRLEDWDWLIRATKFSAIGLLPKPLATIYQTSLPEYERVARAVTRLQDRQSKQFAQIGIIPYLQFRASMANEMAVAHFNRRAYWVAFGWLLRSLIIYPVRQTSYFRRVLAGVVRSLSAESRAS